MSSHDHSSTYPPSTTTTTTIPIDVVDAHILTKLDGPTLASAACASSELRALSTNEDLWMNICNAKWPSTSHPHVCDAIAATFPAFSYRSLFSNCFQALQVQVQNQTLISDHLSHAATVTMSTTELISVVDISYRNKVVYSNVQAINTSTEEFLCSPMCVDLVNVNREVVNSCTVGDQLDELQLVAEQVSLSWIMIDPSRKRAANLSSIQPVSVELVEQEDKLNGEKILLVYSTLIMAGSGSHSEMVEFKIEIICGCIRGRQLVIRDVNLQVVNVDGMVLSGHESLFILQEAMERRRPEIGDRSNHVHIYKDYLKMRREVKVKREKDMALNGCDYACIFSLSIAVTGWLVWYFFWRYILRRKQI